MCKNYRTAATVIASYSYNYLGQRTRKVVGTTTTLYHYDPTGNLLAEARDDGSLAGKQGQVLH